MLYTNEAIKERKKKSKKLKNIIVILVYIILVPILIYNLALIVQSVINPNETPSFLGIKTYVIISGSMKPELDIGDIVIVKKSNDFEMGDIISFRQGQSVITHRISEIIEDNGTIQYKTKGDSNNAEDNGTISKSVIEGKVVGKIKKVGNLAILLQGKTAIIVIVLILFIYIWNSTKVKQRKEERRIKRLEYERRK